MLIVAGPPGSGKTTFFPVTAFGVDSFNIDDRCAQILGSYRAISREVRRAVAKECERFVRDHIEHGLSFAVETTLRTTASIEQAELARKRGFTTHLRFVATDSITENVARCFSERRAAGMARRNGISARFTTRASRTFARRSVCSNASASTTLRRHGQRRDSWPPPTTAGSCAMVSLPAGSSGRSRWWGRREPQPFFFLPPSPSPASPRARSDAPPAPPTRCAPRPPPGVRGAEGHDLVLADGELGFHAHAVLVAPWPAAERRRCRSARPRTGPLPSTRRAWEIRADRHGRRSRAGAS
jgi:predicted ABC-type ATPase